MTLTRLLFSRALADREGEPGSTASAPSTATALAIILVAKFAERAWIAVAVIPATLALLRLVRRCYDDLDRLLLAAKSERMDLHAHALPLVVLPAGHWDSISRHGIDYALRLSPDVTALHCTDLEGPWPSRAPPPRRNFPLPQRNRPPPAHDHRHVGLSPRPRDRRRPPRNWS